MKWIEQGDEPNCGQVAVAVIAGVSVEEVTRIIGHNKRTRTKTLRFALRQWGFEIPDRARPMKDPPPLALAQVRDSLRRHSGWHWVVVAGDKIFDGAWGHPDGHVDWPAGFYIASYLPITRLG